MADPKDAEDSFFGIKRSVSPFKAEALALGQPLTTEALVEATRLLANRFKPDLEERELELERERKNK